MNTNTSSSPSRPKRNAPPPAGGPAAFLQKPFVWFLLCLLVLLVYLFRDSFDSDKVHFSNDAPLGAYASEWESVPGGLFGVWDDLNSIGFSAGGAFSFGISFVLRTLLGALWYSKVYPPLTLLFIGCGAWMFFRCLKFSPLACALGGLAAALNSSFLSSSCWGVGSIIIAFGCEYLALAAVVSDPKRHRWIKFMLAGFAVGMGVMEGIDNGAIFSMLVAAFVVFYSLTAEAGEGGGEESSSSTFFANLGRGILRVAVIAVFAAFIAIQTVTSLVGTQIIGIAGTQQDTRSKAEHWSFATQWSLPKKEALSLLVPGLFGYRMDTPNLMPESMQDAYRGGNYWGQVGMDLAWDEYFAGGPLHPGPVVNVSVPGAASLNTVQAVRADGKIALPGLGEFTAAGKTTSQLQQDILSQASGKLPEKEVAVARQPPGQERLMRFSGGGSYAGVMVVLFALWAALQSLRGKNSVFSPQQRKLIWFWSTAALLSLLLAFGRFAPFYQLVYALPYFSTIRNPAKFVSVVNFSLVILFAYGVQGLWRQYLEAPEPAAGPRSTNWWAKARSFDKTWIIGCAIAFILSLAAWKIYASNQESFEQYLQSVQFDNKDLSRMIAEFSIRQVGWFILFFALAAGLMTLVLSGFFAGRRAKWAGIALGLVLVLDLARANLPWILFWDYKQKYATNDVIELLREKPYEHRVAKLPFRSPPQLSGFEQLYGIEWAQHHFLYYNIQSFDKIQMPRVPEDLAAFEGALFFDQRSTESISNTLHHITRQWELTNTRYLLGAAGYLDVLNEQLDPVKHRFRIAVRFDLALKSNVAQYTGHLEQLTAVIKPEGQFALFEFTGALPRARLYATWQVSTNDQATLNQLTSSSFDPWQTVLVSSPIPAAPTNAPVSGGTVDFSGYSSKHIVLQAKADLPSVLLLNDKFDPNWKVSVDGKPDTLLRCNFIMRGVRLAPGSHTVELRYAPPLAPLYISMVAVALAIALLGVLVADRARGAAVPAAAATKPSREQ